MDKILLIDDDRSSRLVLKHLLEKMGFIVIQSANGRHGWETLSENNDIGFIITDMMMPDMDGRELIQLIRKDEDQQKVPVIIISGCFNPEDIKPILDISPERTFFMNKPLKREILDKYLNIISSLKLNEPQSSIAG